MTPEVGINAESHAGWIAWDRLRCFVDVSAQAVCVMDSACGRLGTAAHH